MRSITTILGFPADYGWGIAASNDTGEDFLGRQTFNRKIDFGIRAEWWIF